MLLLYIGKSLVLLLQYWIHTESIGKLGLFDRYFNSPSNHRVHHGSNPTYLDKNHGGVLMIWDQMFGTYLAELSDAPVVYGLTKALKSYNPFVINFHNFATLFRDIRRAPSLRVALSTVPASSAAVCLAASRLAALGYD